LETAERIAELILSFMSSDLTADRLHEQIMLRVNPTDIVKNGATVTTEATSVKASFMAHPPRCYDGCAPCINYM
jgi:hypothetical protein